MNAIKAMVVIACLAPALANAEVIRGRVVAVYDGDTVTVASADTRHKIRVAGIDAPELRQAAGKESRDALRAAVLHKAVAVEWHKRDRYGRIVGKVWQRRKDAGLGQVRNGWAWHYKKYQGEQSAKDRAAYARAEQSARASRRGLWAQQAPVSPEVFRRAR